jgi:hypothetical protein
MLWMQKLEIRQQKASKEEGQLLTKEQEQKGIMNRAITIIMLCY